MQSSKMKAKDGTDIELVDSRITDAKISSWDGKQDALTDGCIETRHIADYAVKTEKISNDSVTTGKIASVAVTTEKLAFKSVTGQRIADETITSDKLASDSVTMEKIAGLAVTTAKINLQAVTESKIASKAVTTDKLNLTATGEDGNPIFINSSGKPEACTEAFGVKSRTVSGSTGTACTSPFLELDGNLIVQGSASLKGNANTGSSTNPIFINSSGKPEACGDLPIKNSLSLKGMTYTGESAYLNQYGVLHRFYMKNYGNSTTVCITYRIQVMTTGNGYSATANVWYRRSSGYIGSVKGTVRWDGNKQSEITFHAEVYDYGKENGGLEIVLYSKTPSQWVMAVAYPEFIDALSSAGLNLSSSKANAFPMNEFYSLLPGYDSTQSSYAKAIQLTEVS